jgi:hypothetical protein
MSYFAVELYHTSHAVTRMPGRSTAKADCRQVAKSCRHECHCNNKGETVLCVSTTRRRRPVNVNIVFYAYLISELVVCLRFLPIYNRTLNFQHLLNRNVGLDTVAERTLPVTLVRCP